jgi:predicted glycoside hydrolase/deacetylase ChbG (UPF0249 family)
MERMHWMIINADDYGLSDGICRAVHDLFDAGAISSTTLMVAAEGAVDRCQRWKVEQFVGRVGVHLQLTNGIPLMPASEVPSLIERRSGRFGRPDAFSTLDMDEVEREWRAQIERAFELLRGKPSHLDSHHGAHHEPGLADVFIQLAMEFDLPVRDRTAMLEHNPEARLLGSDVVVYDWTARGLSSDDLAAALEDALQKSECDQVIEVVTHPSYIDDELAHVSSLTTLRDLDRSALLRFRRSTWLKNRGMHLVSFSDLW